MAFRDLVAGGAGCSVPGAGPSSSNPLGSLADSILGTNAKTQEKLRELPTLAGPGMPPSLPGLGHPLNSAPLPGFEDAHARPGNEMASEFMRGFHGVDHDAMFGNAWEEASQMRAMAPPQMPFQPPPISGDPSYSAELSAEFDRIYGLMGSQRENPLIGEGSHPPQVLSSFLRSFLDASRSGAAFHAIQLPELGLTQADKNRIRDRSTIMARHFFAGRPDDFVHAQVSALLQSLDIEDTMAFPGPQGPMGGRFHEFEDYWKDAGGGAHGPMQEADRWVNQFHGAGGVPQRERDTAAAWQEEFSQDQGANWAEEMAALQIADPRTNDAAALHQTRALVETLSQNQDPKFQNSKFLQFVSKMSRGEMAADDRQMQPGGEPARWATEFQRQHEGTGNAWVDEFSSHERQGGNWAGEFMSRPMGPGDLWAEEYAGTQGVPRDWADEFANQVSEGLMDDAGANWAESYDRFVEEQVSAGRMPPGSRWPYVFAEQNPYVGHAQPLREGQELFRRGLLSEAVLALEAEVLKNPDNAEGWRLLGIAHAENDDDRQAIASMVRARDADPANLEVLLALGVSHTNELEQAEALSYLSGWLQNHPKYGSLVPADRTSGLSHPEVTAMFEEAARMSPEDADVHTVLGVLFNLSRDYNRAISAFQTALKLQPRDYSLWNKLGATQANSSRSADAIQAYQEALDLKPNYVRAWSNMGIGYANQGRYEESIRYYVRALAMNPKAENAWSYLRISLSCAGETETLAACDRKDLQELQNRYPL